MVSGTPFRPLLSNILYVEAQRLLCILIMNLPSVLQNYFYGDFHSRMHQRADSLAVGKENYAVLRWLVDN